MVPRALRPLQGTRSFPRRRRAGVQLSRRYILLYEPITGGTFDFQAAAAAVDRPAVLAVPWRGSQP